MRIAILSESPADEEGIRILLEGILGCPVEHIRFGQRQGGWAALPGVLRAAMKRLHYRREAERLVVVVDSNHSPLHDAPLASPCSRPQECRLCVLGGIVGSVSLELRPMSGYRPIRVAVGVAAPAIEAWYLCGREHGVSERTWGEGLRTGRFPYTKRRLKELVYGNSRPSLEMETRCAREEMQRVVKDLGLLGSRFPVGFGALLRELKTWTGPEADC